MSDYVRVKDNETGHEHNLLAVQAKQLSRFVSVIDKPTHNPDGTEIPPRYKTTVAKKAAEKKAASQASETTASVESDEKADSPATEKEN